MECNHADNNLLAAVKSHDIEFIDLYKSQGGSNRNILRAASISGDLELFRYIEKLVAAEFFQKQSTFYLKKIAESPEDLRPYLICNMHSYELYKILHPAIRHDRREIVSYIVDKYYDLIDFNKCLPATAFCDNITLTKYFESKGADNWSETIIVALILSNSRLYEYCFSKLNIQTFGELCLQRIPNIIL
jgi:hypothetical protein